MKEEFCPNYSSCQLLQTDLVTDKQELKDTYKADYCIHPDLEWKNCKRFITKQTLNFCPDFVFPDTELSPEEIIDKYDQEIINHV